MSSPGVGPGPRPSQGRVRSATLRGLNKDKSPISNDLRVFHGSDDSHNSPPFCTVRDGFTATSTAKVALIPRHSDAEIGGQVRVPDRESWRYNPHMETNLSAEALTILRRRWAEEWVAVTESNKPHYRELAAAGLMYPVSGFAYGPESNFRFT